MNLSMCFYLILSLLCVASLSHAVGISESETVQVDVRHLFNEDVIVNVIETRNGTQIDSTQAPIDSRDFSQTNYSFMTQSAAWYFLRNDGVGLPDDGYFPATQFHPEIQFAFSNSNTGNNARRLSEPGSFFVPTPEQSYSNVHLYATSGQGQSEFIVELQYNDGVELLTSTIVPEWIVGSGASTIERYTVIRNLDRIKRDATSPHNVNFGKIYGFRFPIDPTRTLEGFTVNVTNVPSGNINGINYRGAFNFFGATAVTAVPEPSTFMLGLSSLVLLLKSNRQQKTLRR